jgi:hypothetical protein
MTTIGLQFPASLDLIIPIYFLLYYNKFNNIGRFTMAIDSAKELGKELKKDIDTFEVSLKIGETILKIKSVGKVAWAVAIGAIGVAVTGILATPATGGVTSALTAASAPAAVSILGVSTTTAAVSIAAAGGGIAVLNKLRKYEIVEKHTTYMVVKRK